MDKRAVNKSLVLFFIVVSVYSVFCLTKYQHARFTADSMLYISLAKKYLAGDYQNAINGYWGPLLAWLIIPFLRSGVSDVLTINILDAIFGIITFIGIWIMSRRLELGERIKNVVIICSLPVVAKFSVVQPMDFLLVSILTLYLCVIFNKEYPRKISSGLISGILGSFAYLTKAYAFPFFIVHFFIMNIFHYFGSAAKDSRKKVIINAVAGFLLFAVISGAWIAVISDKYGHFTFSTMRDTNFNAPGPEVKGGGLEFGVPVFYEGFFAPPNDTAFVVWEDPSYLRGKPWSAWQSLSHLKHFIKLILKNISDALKTFESFSTLSIAIIISCLFLLFERPGKEVIASGELLYPLFTTILFTAGYLLFHLEERYLWLVNILLLLMGGRILASMMQKDFIRSGLQHNLLIGFFMLSFIFVPAKYVIQVRDGGMDGYMHLVSTDLKKYGVKGNIASNREYVPVHDAWHKTFRAAYWLDSKYYGQRGEEVNDAQLMEELRKYKIDYYFYWGEETVVPHFLAGYQEVTNNEIPGLKVYSLKNSRPASDSGGRE